MSGTGLITINRTVKQWWNRILKKDVTEFTSSPDSPSSTSPPSPKQTAAETTTDPTSSPSKSPTNSVEHTPITSPELEHKLISVKPSNLTSAAIRLERNPKSEKPLYEIPLQPEYHILGRRDDETSSSDQPDNHLVLYCGIQANIKNVVFQWRKDDTILEPSERINIVSQETASALKILNPNESDVGFYQCLAENREGGCITSTNVLIRKNPKSDCSVKPTPSAEAQVIRRKAASTVNPRPVSVYVMDNRTQKRWSVGLQRSKISRSSMIDPLRTTKSLEETKSTTNLNISYASCGANLDTKCQTLDSPPPNSSMIRSILSDQDLQIPIKLEQSDKCNESQNKQAFVLTTSNPNCSLSSECLNQDQSPTRNRKRMVNKSLTLPGKRSDRRVGIYGSREYLAQQKSFENSEEIPNPLPVRVDISSSVNQQASTMPPNHGSVRIGRKSTLERHIAIRKSGINRKLLNQIEFPKRLSNPHFKEVHDSLVFSLPENINTIISTDFSPPPAAKHDFPMDMIGGMEKSIEIPSSPPIGEPKPCVRSVGSTGEVGLPVLKKPDREESKMIKPCIEPYKNKTPVPDPSAIINRPPEKPTLVDSTQVLESESQKQDQVGCLPEVLIRHAPSRSSRKLSVGSRSISLGSLRDTRSRSIILEYAVQPSNSPVLPKLVDQVSQYVSSEAVCQKITPKPDRMKLPKLETSITDNPPQLSPPIRAALPPTGPGVIVICQPKSPTSPKLDDLPTTPVTKRPILDKTLITSEASHKMSNKENKFSGSIGSDLSRQSNTNSVTEQSKSPKLVQSQKMLTNGFSKEKSDRPNAFEKKELEIAIPSSSLTRSSAQRRMIEPSGSSKLSRSNDCTNYPVIPLEINTNMNMDFRTIYKIITQVGKGKFGSVYQCVEQSTGQTFAVKTVSLRDQKRHGKDIMEVAVLRAIGKHPQIAHIYAAYEFKGECAIVTEFVHGGALFSRIEQEDTLDEAITVSIIRQILWGLKHLENCHVIHCDLKPENLMMVETTGYRLKIIDFGLAKFYSPKAVCLRPAGTLTYLAPETQSCDPQSYATDLWSVAVIAYEILAGITPFEVPHTGDPERQLSDSEVSINITLVRYTMDYEGMSDVSSEAKDFIKRILVRNPAKRPSVDACLNHPWLVMREEDRPTVKRAFSLYRRSTRRRPKLTCAKSMSMKKFCSSNSVEISRSDLLIPREKI